MALTLLKLGKELVEAADIKVKDGEDTQSFLKRLARAIADVSDDTWNDLSEKAQDWHEAAVKSMNEKEAIDFERICEEDEEEEPPKSRGRSRPKPDDDGDDDGKGKDDDEDDGKKGRGRAKPKDDDDDDDGKGKKEEKPAPRKRTGVTAIMRQLVCEHYDEDKDAIVKRLNKHPDVEDFKTSTLDIMFSETHRIIDLLKENGWREPK